MEQIRYRKCSSSVQVSEGKQKNARKHHFGNERERKLRNGIAPNINVQKDVHIAMEDVKLNVE